VLEFSLFSVRLGEWLIVAPRSIYPPMNRAVDGFQCRFGRCGEHK
jgi:hypothetical protein